MGLIANIFLIIILVIIIVLAIIHRKNIINTDLEDCFNDCNNKCDKNHPAAYYDLCKKRCAIRCGNKIQQN
jgi:hypothetical protein